MNDILLCNFQPYIKFTQILGLLPLSIKNHEIISISKFSIFLILCVEMLSLGHTYYYFVFVYRVLDDEVRELAGLAEVYLLMGFGAISRFTFISQMKFFKIICFQIFQLSTSITDESFFKKLRKIVISEIAVIVFGLVIYRFIHYFDTQNKVYNFSLVLFYLLEIRNIYCIVALNVLFANCLFFCRKTFKKFNDEITFSNEMFCVQTNISSAVLVYNKTLDLCGLLNKCFGVPMALSSIITIIEIILGSFIIVSYKYFYIMTFMVWMVYFMAAEWFVLYACEITTEEVGE